MNATARLRRIGRHVHQWAAAGTAIGAWLVLTALFAAGGIAVLGAAEWVLSPAPRVVVTLVQVLGALLAINAAPTLASKVVETGTERANNAFEATRDRVPDRHRSSPCVVDRRGRCRPSCCS